LPALMGKPASQLAEAGLAPSERAPRVLFFVTEDWFFCSHFIDRAVAAKAAGYEVAVLTRVRDHGELIRNKGLRLIPIELSRHGLNPLRELRTVWWAYRSYRAFRPDLVHHFALKPIVEGTPAALLLGVKHIVNAPVGMGFVFSSRSGLARLLRPVVRFALHALLNPAGSRVVFENPDDLEAAVRDRLVRRQDAVLIRGAGVDLKRFRLTPEPDGVPTVVLIARMLWDKGVGEYVEAARSLKRKGLACRFLLVGAPDARNPAAIGEEQLRVWQREAAIEWLGHRSDVEQVLAATHIVCLPSYREGLPKSLLEALAAGRPIVATDVPGCREAVRDGENGILVPSRNSVALADALETLIRDPTLRRRYGASGRRRAETEFVAGIVNAATLRLYREMLGIGRQEALA
jgi:glycosyltransferase involved in cell wall biosynthesis